ncbi:MAG: 16S rRNA (guanine(966)-N(2))-methyltransferase RsmD, partial [Smithellaceae bacterium]|nr:16S rRNA (guanine(966)-N(2))-methyltransferase RsmD [Smithellaceae bacterium]
EAKGRLIRLPKGASARPTADRIKEARFNIIAPVTGKSFLDIYAGSGSVGLEAISRGAARAVFIERDRKLASALEASLEELDFIGRGEVLCADMAKAIRTLATAEKSFDIVFADPPYGRGYLQDAIDVVGDTSILSSGGAFILQHSTRDTDWQSGSFEIIDQRRYGDTAVSFMKYKG